MFSKETYIQRRNTLKKNFKNGIILFFGNDETGMNYADNTYHFRQDSTFLYYFGINKKQTVWVEIVAPWNETSTRTCNYNRTGNLFYPATHRPVAERKN